ncbi:MAG: cytochrome c biogenesis protein CcsA [Methylococcaceae bacterium]|nr:cytochrome c biogenesis protein CcsA [Methylococcaceae bacterium]MDZ4156676.1 cytochrome c biogenesis protein CcsA [Methylococcales bacterium]MDP2394826.1 cytochrome c biogenesis protein CcsA [Methylococcaceae bacterium]MDP3020247.1 cytochrome c biogenesis protein CcsA [Methylococcaceae bacterium]MDP3390788.1 cytochrome c biogenesis protein CcsA [Methylococcaceae bacterium]
MNTIVIAIFSIATYLLSAILITRHISQSATNRTSIYLAWLAICGHAAYIVLIFKENDGFNFSFTSTASFIAFIVSLILLIAAIDKPVEKLGIVLFPTSALMLGLAATTSSQPHFLRTYNWEMGTHILTSIVAFSLLNIAALQAILLAIQNQQLKSHPPKRLIRSLPSLQTMESLLFQMITAGLLFLTVSLITGFIFVDDLFAQHLAHKTVLSLTAWIIFSSLLLGRIRYGWRGKTAIRWTLIGFGALLLAYFGSKLVLELILRRN